MIWFSSDFHFFHKNIINLCNRPFSGIEDMHEFMIQEWNKRVKATEKIYVLGDFSFRGPDLSKSILDRLSGYKILILGNHDMAPHKALASGFNEVYENLIIEIGNKKKVLLSHFPYHPMLSFKRILNYEIDMKFSEDKVDMRYLHKRSVDDGCTWLLHGHVHNSWTQNGRQINVGVDVNKFKPISHEKILEMIKCGPQFIGKKSINN